MRVYLIAAPEDEAEADKLAAYLKRFGVFIRSEYGQYSYPPARHGEYTLALWSRNAMMSSRQMMLTNRAIDAWEHDQLIMARLEHGLSPRGLADLKMVDLTFEAAREHRYRDVLNALRALEDARRQMGGQASEGREFFQSGVDESEEGEAATESEDDVVARAADRLADEVNQSERARESRSASASSSGGMFSMSNSSSHSQRLIDEHNQEIAKLRQALSALGYTYPLPKGGLFGWLQSKRGRAKKIARQIEHLTRLVLREQENIDAQAEEQKMLPLSRAPVLAPENELAAAAGAAHTVFVSYSHANAETVLPIVETVEERGVSIWIDRDEMRAGQGWAGQIVRAIKSSERFCLMCSAQAFASDHVRREVYLADKYGKDMVPIRLDGAEMPEDIEYFLIGKQWVDLNALEEDERLAVLESALSGAVN